MAILRPPIDPVSVPPVAAQFVPRTPWLPQIAAPVGVIGFA
jgi:hypothetical protein